MSEREKIIQRFRRALAEIRETYAICEYWNDNVRKEHEARINPDPDGMLERMEASIVKLLKEDKGYGPILYELPCPPPSKS